MKRYRVAQLVAFISVFFYVAAETGYGQPPRGRGNGARSGGASGGQGGKRGGGGGSNNARRDASATVSPVAPGESGIAWYSTWETASKEAKRSNRPILYMAAAAQCGGVPGVF